MKLKELLDLLIPGTICSIVVENVEYEYDTLFSKMSEEDMIRNFSDKYIYSVQVSDNTLIITIA